MTRPRIGLLLMVVLAILIAATPAHAATPVAGRLCKLAEIGRLEGELVCVLVNTRAVWRRSGATTTTASTADTTKADLEALELLAGIPVENEHRGGYQRDLFPHWLDLDGDGCDTRENAMRRDSATPVRLDPHGCKVVAGTWAGVYDGTVSSDPAKVDVDHVVSLKEAWDSGAWAWSVERRAAFANDLTDPRTLRITGASVQRAKGDRDPSNWIPPLGSAVCPYLGDWVAVKARWGLSMDQSEYGRIRNLLAARCPGLRIRPWRPVELPTIRVATTTSPLGVVSTPEATATTTGPGAVVEPYYANCTAAKTAGAAPLRRGQPGYRPALDRDGDGVACSS